MWHKGIPYVIKIQTIIHLCPVETEFEIVVNIVVLLSFNLEGLQNTIYPLMFQVHTIFKLSFLYDLDNVFKHLANTANTLYF